MNQREQTKLKDLLALLNQAVLPIVGLKLKSGEFHDRVEDAVNKILRQFEMVYSSWAVQDTDGAKYRSGGYLTLELEKIADKRMKYESSWKVQKITFIPLFDASASITIADYLKLIQLQDLEEREKSVKASIEELKGKLLKQEGFLTEAGKEITALKAELKIA